MPNMHQMYFDKYEIGTYSTGTMIYHYLIFLTILYNLDIGITFIMFWPIKIQILTKHIN